MNKDGKTRCGIEKRSGKNRPARPARIAYDTCALPDTYKAIKGYKASGIVEIPERSEG
jgi:hypothetical protein